MYLSVMWNWGGFASAICRPATGRRVPAAADVTMSWVSIIPRFHLLAWPALSRFAGDDLVSAYPEGLQ